MPRIDPKHSLGCMAREPKHSRWRRVHTKRWRCRPPTSRLHCSPGSSHLHVQARNSPCQQCTSSNALAPCAGIRDRVSPRCRKPLSWRPPPPHRVGGQSASSRDLCATASADCRQAAGAEACDCVFALRDKLRECYTKGSIFKTIGAPCRRRNAPPSHCETHGLWVGVSSVCNKTSRNVSLSVDERLSKSLKHGITTDIVSITSATWTDRDAMSRHSPR